MIPPEWRTTVRERAEALMPPGSHQRRYARVGLRAYRVGRSAGRSLAEVVRRDVVSHSVPFGYREWFRATRSTPEELEELGRPSPAGASFDVTVVVFGDPGGVEGTRASLAGQVRAAGTVLERVPTPPDGAAALAAALEAAPDDHFVLGLRAGDELEPDALARLLDRAEADPRARVLTWDDDVRSGGQPHDPRFRPVTYSPDLLLSANPYGRSVAIRADAARAAGGLRPELGLDAVWDLLLRMGLEEHDVLHVPRVLAHLAGRPPAVGAHGPRVVAAHLQRLGLHGETTRRHGAVQIRWTPQARPAVSVLVPTRHNTALVGPLIDSLRGTDYPDWELVVVDNGGRSDEHERFYAERAAGIDHRVLWWDEPFNYGAVNNAAARVARGEVLVLLNDDTRVHSPGWLDELVGWLGVPGVGTVGVQLIDPEGLIQHGGAIIGAAGLADHRFQGLPPHSDTMLGSTDWYRDSSANTAACVAVRRSLWDDIGGLDERFTLCGSDVVLGLEARRRGLRNVCTPAIHVDHLESATRRTNVPVGDVFASYWRYSRHLRAGDPYHNPNVSLVRREPSLRAPDEPTALERVGPALGRTFGGAFRQTASEAEARAFALACRADDDTAARVRDMHREHAGQLDVGSVNWFVPNFENPFYGGLATIFRIADHLGRNHGVENRFVVWGEGRDEWFRSGITAAFPGLESSELVFCKGLGERDVRGLPPADVSIATQWQTAYQVAHFPHTLRKHYLIQDFEPMFNPAGTLYALAEETYRLGLRGLCNTAHLLDVYRERYGGEGASFTPAVDGAVFHADGRRERRDDEPLNVFVYARPGHWRNCWELVEPALHEVKRRFGRRVRIVTAGAWTSARDVANGIDHLGLLDYADTGALYRTCDVGISLTVSEHPSYLPLELMACGVPVVAFDLPAGYWVLRDGENSLLARRTVDSLADRVTRLVEDGRLRERLRDGGLATIRESHASWEANLAGIHEALGAPLRLDDVPGPPSGGPSGGDGRSVREAAGN